MDRFDRDIGFPKKSRIYLFNQKRKKSGGNGVDETLYFFLLVIYAGDICVINCLTAERTGKAYKLLRGKGREGKQGNYLAEATDEDLEQRERDMLH